MGPLLKNSLTIRAALSISVIISCCDVVKAESSNSGGFFGKVFCGLFNSSYKNTPEFKQYVSPYIIDMGEFDAFMLKYNFKNKLTEKDGIDIIIKLGILKYKPEWLNKNALNLINKYYPGIRNRKAQFNSGKLLLAENCSDKVIRDFHRCEYSIASAADIVPIMRQVAPPMIALLTLNGLSKKNTLENLKNEISQIIEELENGFCKGNCVHESVTDDSKKGEESCQEQWAEARELCAREMKKYSPSRNFTGGFTDINKCAKGLVSMACGGNRV